MHQLVGDEGDEGDEGDGGDGGDGEENSPNLDTLLHTNPTEIIFSREHELALP